MENEKLTVEYKSIKKIRSGGSGFNDLAITCVGFANAIGGHIYIGIEDKTLTPPENQVVEDDEANKAIKKLRGLCFNVHITCSEIFTHENNGQYFIIHVYSSSKSIATTSDGKIYLRIADECVPVRSEDISHLLSEKEAFQWELINVKDIEIYDIPESSLGKFADKIRASKRVSDHVKQMSDLEIAENYNLIYENHLTYLGVLWLGNAFQRSRITYPITVQYIVYDVLENKIRKLTWHDNLLNPEELLIDIEQKATELKYYYEFPDGLFRRQIYHYHPKVIRELLINAFAHKSFTLSGDVFINVYSDRLEITNPGGLPLGVTPSNILHERRRRNPHLIRIMSDLGLMEGEGSGYDLIYELNSLDSKEQPIIESKYSSTTITQYSKILNIESIQLLDYINSNYQLSQKEITALGFIVRYEKILSTKLTTLLQLTENDRLRNYTTRLIEMGIVITRGLRKGNEFLINPKLLSNSKLNIKTSLITIEPHRLIALIEEDIRIHPNTSIKEIGNRLPDVDIKDIRKLVYNMVKNSILEAKGANKNKSYSLAIKK